MEGENPARREDEMERRTRHAGGECVGVGSSRGEISGSWAGLGDWQRLVLGSPSGRPASPERLGGREVGEVRADGTGDG